MSAEILRTPWTWHPNLCGEPGGIITDAKANHLAKPHPHSPTNARLMAAAPDLLEALEEIIGEAAFEGLPESKQDAIYRAIEKATKQ